MPADVCLVPLPLAALWRPARTVVWPLLAANIRTRGVGLGNTPPHPNFFSERGGARKCNRPLPPFNPGSENKKFASVTPAAGLPKPQPLTAYLCPTVVLFVVPCAERYPVASRATNERNPPIHPPSTQKCYESGDAFTNLRTL